jgi:hypothetical protein
VAGGPGLAPDVVGPRSLLPGETISLPLAPAKTVAGRVRDAKGEAVAGASVRLLEEPPGNWLGGARPALLGFEARTDAGGAFSLGGLPPGPFAVLVLAGEMGVLRIENAWAEDGPLDLRLPAPGAVRGTIRTEPGGRPLAGARVILSPLTVAPFLEPREATTDEKGRWRVSGLPRAGYRVEVLAEGHLQVRPLEVVPRPGEELPDVDLTLRPLGALEGKVATKGTDAIAGARVYLRYPRSEEWFTVPDPRAPLAITDAKGSFLIERLPPEVRVRMAVVADGFAPAVLDDVAVAGGAPTKLAPVFLEKGAVLRGRVLAAGEGEAPIAGATVMAVPLDEDPRGTLGGGGDGWRARRARTGEDGRFRIEGLRAGTYRLAAVRDDRRPVVSGAVEASVDEKKAAEHVLRLPEGARLDGTVRDAEDRPVVGALVEVAEEPGGTRFRRTTSAADGSFSFAGLAPGRFIVSASAEGLAPARREGVLAGRPVAIVLMAPGAVSGTVTAGPEDEGVPPFSLAALRREERDPGEPGRARYVPVFFGRFRAAGGAFRAELPAGIYRLEVEVAGGRAGSVEGVEVRGGSSDRGRDRPHGGLRRDPGPRRGRPDGGGAEGAVVSLLSPGSDAARTSVVADGNGEFRLDGVPVGMATIVVEGRDRAPVRVGGIRIHEGLVSSIDDVVLGPGRGSSRAGPGNDITPAGRRDPVAGARGARDASRAGHGRGRRRDLRPPGGRLVPFVARARRRRAHELGRPPRRRRGHGAAREPGTGREARGNGPARRGSGGGRPDRGAAAARGPGAGAGAERPPDGLDGGRHVRVPGAAAGRVPPEAPARRGRLGAGPARARPAAGRGSPAGPGAAA